VDQSPVVSSQRLENVHLLLLWLAFIVEGQEKDWLVRCQNKVSGWSISFICGIVLRCVGSLKPGVVWTSTADLKPTVVYLQTRTHSLTHIYDRLE